MATNSPNPGAPMSTPTPTPTPKRDNSKQRFIAIAAVVIVALLAINAFLLVSYNKRGKVNTQLTSSLDESEQLKAELQQQYYTALSELEEMRGSNEELNAMIEQQKEELKTQKTRIEGLLQSDRNLGRARKEMAEMKANMEQYLAEINQLREQNAELSSQNSQLSENNELLNQDLTMERTNAEQLNSDKAMLVSEKEQLSSKNANLSRKVNIASTIKIESFEVEPMMIRKSGNAVKRNNADRIDYLRICFNTKANEIAEPGVEQFIVRIIDPSGQTLAIDQLGSGVFTSNATGEQIRYTTTGDLDFDRSASNVCTDWKPGQPFVEGNYDVEIYNKGFLAGSTSFQLK